MAPFPKMRLAHAIHLSVAPTLSTPASTHIEHPANRLMGLMRHDAREFSREASSEKDVICLQQTLDVGPRRFSQRSLRDDSVAPQSTTIAW